VLPVGRICYLAAWLAKNPWSFRNTRGYSSDDVCLQKPGVNDVGLEPANQTKQLPENARVVGAAGSQFMKMRLGQRQMLLTSTLGQVCDVHLMTHIYEFRYKVG
jgi:hypothetical protein